MNKEDFKMIMRALETLAEMDRNPNAIDTAYCPSCLVGQLNWQESENHIDGGHWVCNHCKKGFRKGFSYSKLLRQRIR